MIVFPNDIAKLSSAYANCLLSFIHLGLGNLAKRFDFQ